MEFDSVQIGAPDVAATVRAYALLLGATADGRGRFQLRYGAIEIESGTPGVRCIRFAVERDADQPHWSPDIFHGLRVSCVVRVAPPAPVAAAACIEALDHVVVNSPDLDRAIVLWRDRLGLRLALDREFPQRGMRLVFFRSGGVTLEVAGSLPPPDDRTGADAFHGLAYRVRDLDACRARLLDAGVDVSEVRAGHKRGTRVATVRSGTEGVPTLLIQDPSRVS